MMENRIVILPYKMGSASARALQDRLQELGANCLRVYPNRRYRPRKGDFIVNWGYGGNTNWDKYINLNEPMTVYTAINKLRCFEILKAQGVDHVEFTAHKDVAQEWAIVYARTKLCGSGGDGIGIFVYGDVLPNASLYTKGIRTLREYRVHVMCGEVIDYTKKLRRKDQEYQIPELLVRNHKSGWVFARQDITRLERVEKVAISAVGALNLDFGAVDIVIDEEGVARVLEVNTAMGLVGTTLENYANKIKELSEQSG